MRKILIIGAVIFLANCTSQKDIEVVSGVTHIITSKDIKDAQR